ncbi:MAG: galactokinase [Promethearchaeota archaeon]
MNEFEVSAPGRVCLFGEHQDYLQLAVIPSAINMRTRIHVKERKERDNSIIINALDLDEIITVPIKAEYGSPDQHATYFQSVISLFAKKGYLNRITPFECEVTSKIPIKSGLSSSAALLVAFVKVLSIVTGINLQPRDVGLFAYEAEHDVMGIPCGMMDQLSSAMGGIIHMKCVTPPVITPLDISIDGLIIADTQISKSTSNVHTVRVAETRRGLENLAKLVEFNLETTPYSKVEPFLKELDEIERNRLIAVFKDRDITNQSLTMLRDSELDYQAIGNLLIEHQKYLREYFEVSVEKIDDIISNSLKAGALGGKLTGAGLGGSIVILSPNHQDDVCKAIEDAGGVPYRVNVDSGVK